MHKFYNFTCREIKALEDKMEKGLTSAELDYGIKLVDLKKNILKCWKLEGETEEKKDPGYSRAINDITHQLDDMLKMAPDEMTRAEISNLIDKMHRA